MEGDGLNQYLERGLGRPRIRQLTIRNLGMTLSRPSNPRPEVPFIDSVDSVTQQAHRVDAAWDAATATLTVEAAATGPGYWIPYLGNGIPHIGTDNRGLGTFTPIVTPPISWVATGPFSGCHAYVFPGPRFAHVITPADHYTADTIPNQLGHIAAASGGTHSSGGQVPLHGIGYVFWTFFKGVWHQREVYIPAGNSGPVILLTKRRPV